MKQIKRLFFYLWPIMKKYPLTLVWSFLGFGIGSVLAQIIKPIFFKQIIDIITEAGTPLPELAKPLLTLVAIVLGLQIIYNLFFRSGDYALSYFESNVMRDIHMNVFQKLTAHSYQFFSNTFGGSLVAKEKRLKNSFETIYDVVIWRFWGFLLSIVGVFVVLFIEDSTLGLIFLAWSIIYVVVTLWLIQKKMKYDLVDAAADSKVISRLADIITNIMTVKIFARERAETTGFRGIVDEEESKRRSMWYFGNFTVIIQALLMIVLEVGAMYLAVVFWLDGSISAGTVVLIQMYLAIIFNRLWELGNSITKFVKAVSDSTEMIDIIEQPIDIQDPVHPEKSSISHGDIRFNNITFSYHSDDAVLQDFSLHIPAGQKVGLVGISGSGKSTLVKLILRFADIDRGDITIDNQPITAISQQDLRSHIAFVPQEPLLFHRTIFENIKYGKLDATTADVEHAAKQAYAHDFIVKLPHGYESLVGERGIKLSGGERQRIAIARAILKDAPIVILDEATSSLDSISEQYIQDALDKLIEHKTTIIIAHRLSTIQRMDRILVMKDGKIVEDGMHAELLSKKGEYFKLWSHQKAGFIE